MHFAKQVVRRAFGLLGLRISRAVESPAPERPIAPVHHRADVVFDVGANAGQYGSDLRRQGYQGRIVSFEPLPDAHELLVQRAASDAAWTVHPRAALGASIGDVEINIAGNSYSSSILPMLPAHYEAAPGSHYVGTVQTRLITLDSVVAQYLGPGERAFLKIDTQGSETDVLKGATASLDQIMGVQLEITLVPLYEGQDLYDVHLEFFRERGFVLWDAERVFHDERTGRCLQLDAVFVRKEYC